MTVSRTPPRVSAGQLLHLVCLAVLLALAWIAWKRDGEPFPAAFWVAVAFPVAHQVFVWLAWRLELRSSATSRVLGFRAYLTVFFLLLSGRVVSLLALAWMDRGSLGLPSGPRVLATATLSLIWIYLGYSLGRYFGFARAAGADHFDSSYRDRPLVREGIFRLTSNGMYVFGFLGLWAIAIGFASSAALIVAAFSHIYIWVHFHGTEKPDMNFLYDVP